MENEGVPGTMDGGDSGGSTNPVLKIVNQISLKWQWLLDQSTPYVLVRWITFVLLYALLLYRSIFILGRFWIVIYMVSIFLLNLCVGFVSPAEDSSGRGPLLPYSASAEFRPFQRKLPEFKFWFRGMLAVIVGQFATMFDMFDVPVFWPVLVLYFMLLLMATLRTQIAHMWKHGYVPWDFGRKKRFDITSPMDASRAGPKFDGSSIAKGGVGRGQQVTKLPTTHASAKQLHRVHQSNPNE